MKTFVHNVTRVRDQDTKEWRELPSISGKTAYQYALEGGYTGTEDEFRAKMAAETITVDDLDLSAYATKEYVSPMTEEEIAEICVPLADETGSIPIATQNTIGCVAVGDGLSVTEEGVVSADVTSEEFDSVKTKVDDTGDYIVERGNYTVDSETIWDWIKYANGEIVIEHRWIDVQFYFELAYGSMYYQTYNKSIPSQVPILANTLFYATVEFIGGSGLTSVNTHTINTATNSIGYYAWNPSSTTINKNVLFTFKGRWK